MKILDRIKMKIDEVKFTYQLTKMGTRGMVGMKYAEGIIGLLVLGTVAVALLPSLLSNFSDSTIWTGTGGTLVRTLVPIILVVVLIQYVMAHGKGGKK